MMWFCLQCCFFVMLWLGITRGRSSSSSGAFFCFGTLAVPNAALGGCHHLAPLSVVPTTVVQTYQSTNRTLAPLQALMVLKSMNMREMVPMMRESYQRPIVNHFQLGKSTTRRLTTFIFGACTRATRMRHPPSPPPPLELRGGSVLFAVPVLFCLRVQKSFLWG